MPAVDEVEAKVVRLPLRKPVRLASRTIAARDWLLVRVRTDDGAEGFGFSFAGYEGGERAGEIVRRVLQTVVGGQDPLAVSSLWLQCYRALQGYSSAGLSARAISAIDIALWDRNARVVNLPLHRYIGSVRTEPIPVYAGAGYYGSSPGEDVDALADLVDRGFQTIKVKVGALPRQEEAVRIRTFRIAAGERTQLIADANGAWRTAFSAVQSIEALLGESRLEYIEDPLPSEAMEEYRCLRENVRIPVACGETYSSPHDFKRAIGGRVLDIAQVDATACGGVTGFRMVAAVCAATGTPLETHWFPSLHAHLGMTTTACRRVEVFPDAEIVNFGAIARDDARISSRQASPGEAPGHGIEIDWQ